MKKEQKTNVMRILEKEKIDYKARYYPHGKEAVDGATVASLTGQDPPSRASGTAERYHVRNTDGCMKLLHYLNTCA